MSAAPARAMEEPCDCEPLRAARVRVGDAARVLVAIPLRCDPRLSVLTRAELEVVRALMAGSSNARIGAERGTAIRTVANQVRRIFAKIGVSSRAELAIELGDAALGIPRDEEGTPVTELEPIEPAAVFEALAGGRLRCATLVRGTAELHVLFAEVEQPSLSARRLHVLRALVQKTPIKAIARDLAVSEATVWSEVAVLTRLLGLRDRTELLQVVAPLAPSSWRA